MQIGNFPLGRGPVSILACAAVITWSGCVSLEAQPVTSCLSSNGQTSQFVNFDPHNPTPRAPVTPAAAITTAIPFLPVVPQSEYDATKAELFQHALYNFAGPAQVDNGPGPKAPVPPPPIVTSPTSSWQGIQDTGLVPATPDLAVGPNDVLMVVNSAIAQYDRSGTLKQQTPFTTWFNAVLPTVCINGTNDCLLFDPWITYDQLHGRFLFIASATTASPQNRFHSWLLLSVSNGATYDGGWKIWVLDTSMDGSTLTLNWGDSWRLGLDDAAVYLSGNQFGGGSGLFQYAKMRVLKKSELYNPATTTLHWKDITSLQNAIGGSTLLINSDGSKADSLMPVHERGRPDAATAGFYVNATGFSLPSTTLSIWKIADPLADTLCVTRSTITGLISYNLPAPAPQLGGVAPLDSGDARVLKAIYRNGFIYTARDTGYTDTPTTVTFDVIDTSTLAGTFQVRLTNTNAFYPAFDVPPTTPSGVPFAANLVTGTTTAPDGSLTYAGVTRLKAGEDYYSVNFNGTSRWGDYFGGTVDPITGGLWVSGQYAKPRATGFGQWGTWAGYFPWLTTPVFTDIPTTSFFADYINVLAQWKVTLGCTTTTFCPTDLVTRGQMAAFVIRALYGDTFTYTTTPYFTDVPATYPFFSYIQKMRDLGIIHGCTPTAYCPDSPIVRMDAATILVRAKLESVLGDTFSYPTTQTFTDVPPSFSQFPYVQKLAELGITSGCTPTLFCPLSNLTRQEMAVFLTRSFLN